MKEIWTTFRRELKSLCKLFFFRCYLPSMACGFLVECCSRRSVTDALLFLIREPLVFLYNVLLIAATASVCLMFKRQIFALTVVLLLWTVIGVIDMVLLFFRTTPFTAVDLALVKDAFSIAHRYLSWFGVVLIILGFLGAVALCVVLFRKAKKEENSIPLKLGIPFCGLLVVSCLAFTNLGMGVGLLDRNFGNLAQAFHENGLPYCFLNSVLNTGIAKPEDYSKEAVDEFLDRYEQEEGHALVTPTPTPSPTPTPTPTPSPTPTPTPTEIPKYGEEYPNIIFLQLESFFDVKYIKDFSCTEDPIPFFSLLKEKNSSGFLEVPSIGAGTANTEFECITGMNMDFFGPGEYPYKTILNEHTCESTAYVLKELGFSTTAMHNNDGVFYGRNEVFANLGFDRYVSMEYMKGLEYNELNWAKDKALTGEIMEVLETTPQRDFIYAISVQGHGAYPEEPLLPETILDVQLPRELSEYYYQYLYYVHQLREMDNFLKELVLNLSACREKVVLVLYGDHLPSLGLSGELLSNGNAFQTEYVIWSNFGLKAEDKNLQAFQLSARVLQMLGIEEGIMPKYHMYRCDEEDYLENMRLLMYDMLYGKLEVFEGVNPYAPTNMQMGLKEICILDVYGKHTTIAENGPLLYVRGQNFTEWSKIVINGEEVETVFITEELLGAAMLPESEDGVYYVKVLQKGDDEMALSETDEMKYSVGE